MRLNKYLARCGIGSRRKCDDFIKEGLIKINGKISLDFSYKIKNDDLVKFKNKILNIVEEDFFYILNKPTNYVCSTYDELNRKKILDLIPSNIRLFTIGRLDYNTTGIILITNNGDVANKILHPRNNIERKYYVQSSGKFIKSQLLEIKEGIKINNFFKLKADISFVKKNNDKSYVWDVIMNQGKNREIRRMFENFNLKVLKLHRYEFAGFKLGNLKPGKYRKIKNFEIKKYIYKK